MFPAKEDHPALTPSLAHSSTAWKVNFDRILAEKGRLLKREALGPSLPPREKENLYGKGIISFSFITLQVLAAHRVVQRDGKAQG